MNSSSGDMNTIYFSHILGKLVGIELLTRLFYQHSFKHISKRMSSYAISLIIRILQESISR